MVRANRWTLGLLVLSLAGCERTQSAPPRPPTESATAPTPQLDPDQLAHDLRVLADDGWAGRYTKDLEHLGLAADYIAQSHAAAGLRPVGDAYRIDFEYPAGTKPGNDFHVWIQVDGKPTQVDQATILPARFGTTRAVIGDAVMVPADSAEGVAGKIVVTPAPTTDPGARLQALADAGATAALLTTETLPEGSKAIPEGPLHAAWIGVDAAGAIEAGTPVSLARVDEDEKAEAPNVLAWIEGTEHPEEIVLLGAHYDHIGTKDFGTFCRSPDDDTDPQDVICNGADDNASGTALLMNIARAIGSSGYRPKRTLVFAHFAAEELGLLGSRALAESPPAAAPFSTGRVVAMLNMDMVGRLGADGLQVGGEKTSSAWPELIAQAAPAALQITHPETVTGRSDHAHWFRQGIPTLFFFTGLHGDYHRTSDELEALNLDGIVDIGALVLGLTLELADGAPIPPIPK